MTRWRGLSHLDRMVLVHQESPAGASPEKRSQPMSRSLLVTLLCAASLGAHAAEDSPAARKIAADRYLSVAPIARLVDDTFVEMGKQMPPEQRADFLREVKVLVRVENIEAIARDSMIRHFTADELNALADFYGSSVGASAMKKFGAYMADVAPALQLELRRGMQELGKNKAK